MDRKLSFFLQILVFISLYFLYDDIQCHTNYDTNYFLTRLFFLNVIACVLYYIKRTENDILFDHDDIFFVGDNQYNYFHFFWLINVVVIISMIVNNFSKNFFIKTNSYEDWVHIYTMFFSTFIHYGMHNKITQFTQFNPQSPIACLIHVLHYSCSFISFLSYLVINQLSPQDSYYQPLQKMLFYIIFCKFFVILRMPLAGDIGKVCYSVLLLIDIFNRFQQINQNELDSESNNQQQNSSNKQFNNLNSTNGVSFLSQAQFLIAVALSSFSILCYSVYCIYKAWKYLDFNVLMQERSLLIDNQRLNELFQQSVEIRTRMKSTDGLNDIEFQSLKKTQLEPIQKEHQQSQTPHTCSICYLEIENTATVYSLSCNHKFHTACLDSWLKNKNSCPNCRQKVIQRNELLNSSISNEQELSSVDVLGNGSQQLTNFENMLTQQQSSQPNFQIQSSQQIIIQSSINTFSDEESPPRTSENLNTQQLILIQ